MTHAYVAEPVNMDSLETLFINNWDTRTNGEIPRPAFSTTDIVRGDPMQRSTVNIKAGELTEEIVGYPFQHVRRRLPVTLDVWTNRSGAAAGGNGRQHLHNLKQEIRRICFSNRHSLTNWHIVRYQGFQEQFDDSVAGRFHGVVRIQLEQDAAFAESSLIRLEDFNRANAATLGGDWAAVAGTWGIDTNRADLQTATALAHARYTVQTLPSSLRMRCLIVPGATVNAGLIFRWQDATNYWYVRLQDDGVNQFMRLSERNAGVEIQVMEVRFSADSFGGWIVGTDSVELIVDLLDADIEVSYNGVVMFRRTDTFLQTETDFGLFSDNDQLVRFDNFAIYERGGSGA